MPGSCRINNCNEILLKMQSINSYPPLWEHRHVEETASTMLDLRQPPYTASNAPFLLLTAEYQTAGRGQRGTHWEADRGTNLLFGIRFHPTFLQADRQFLLSEVQALAVVEVLDEHVGCITVKWPNDIYCLDYKICGMLLEHTLSGREIETTITGVGLNVNQRAFKSDAPNPISLRQITCRVYNLEQLMQQISWRFQALIQRLKDGGADDIHRSYLRRLYWCDGHRHRFADAQGVFEAELKTVLPDGRLVLCDEAGRMRTYAFKEVRFLIEKCQPINDLFAS